MTKSQLRTYYKQQRTSISEKEKMKLDDLLLIQFQHLAFENVQSLFTYFPMPHHAEPDTLLFSRYLQHMILGLQIACPVTDLHQYTMQAFIINEDTVYQTNTYGINEPLSQEKIDPEKIDLIFVPLLICDKKGYRVGFGKGIYDKYLAECKEDVLKIGFGYFDPVEKITDIQPYDIPLDYYITPHTIYAF